MPEAGRAEQTVVDGTLAEQIVAERARVVRAGLIDHARQPADAVDPLVPATGRGALQVDRRKGHALM